MQAYPQSETLFARPIYVELHLILNFPADFMIRLDGSVYGICEPVCIGIIPTMTTIPPA